MPVLALLRPPAVLTVLCALSLAVETTVAKAASSEAAARVYAARTSGGALRVLTVVTKGAWPAGGLRIEDTAGAVLMAHVAADAAGAAKFDAATQNALRAFQHPPAAGERDARTANTILILRLLSDWEFARAAGAAAELPAGVHAGAVRVVLLNADGSAAATVGPAKVLEDTGPAAPRNLKAAAELRGVTLSWQSPAGAPSVPVFAYTVQRTVGAGREALTLHPQLLTLDKAGAANPFIDHAPPVETAVSYELRLVDVLGMASTPASVQVESPDFQAGAPPSGLAAKAGRGLVTLTWTALANSRASGLMVERSQLADGPYEWLTPKGLSPESARFEDHDVHPGASYYYRVRAVTPGGSLGAAPDPVRAQPLAPNALTAPQGLAAEVGTSQVVLTWKAVPGVELAGYIVERRSGERSPRWARLDSRLVPGPRYLDLIGAGAGGSFDYRVTAVATDEGVSAPSAALHVALRNSEPPAPPVVLAASGAEGRVQIQFAAAEPAEKTARVALVRADSAAAAGLVVGAPVNGAAGTIADEWVQPGQAYWYRLVAFDKDGNRSAESDAYSVRVGAVALKKPRAPDVTYAAQPSPRVTVGYQAPPPHIRVLVEVQLDDGRWRTVAGPTVESSAVDLAPPSPHASYRIVYVGESGGGGPPSDAAAPR